VNIAKNPRVKRLDFATIAVSVDIPKHLALTSVAIRMLHFNWNYESISNRFPSELMPLVNCFQFQIVTY
jgi:hypothetical protein